MPAVVTKVCWKHLAQSHFATGVIIILVALLSCGFAHKLKFILDHTRKNSPDTNLIQLQRTSEQNVCIFFFFNTREQAEFK